MTRAHPLLALVTACGVALPVHVAGAAAPAATDRHEPLPGWDDEPIPPAPGPAPAPPPVAAVPEPAPALDPDERPLAQPSEGQRRAGNGLWIGAGVTAGIGLVLNGARAHIVSGPCQTDNGTGGCETAWGLVTPFNMAFNIVSIALAGAGGGLRGRYDATVDPERHAGRKPVMVSVGASLLALGVAASIAVRTLWFVDWVDPTGAETFDFSRSSGAFGYYGSLQASSMAAAVGLAMLVHGTARPRRTAKRRGHMLVMPSGAGLSLVGRF